MAAGIGWLVIIVPTLGLSPLSSREGLLLSRVGSPLLSSSPLFEAALWSIAALGPPADVILRLMGLVTGALGAIAAHRLITHHQPTDLSASPVAWFAAFGLGCHGTVLVALTSFSPMVLLWGGVSALVLFFLDLTKSGGPSTTVLVATSITSVLIIMTEPVSLVLLTVLAAWLALVVGQRRGAVAIFVPALLCFAALIAAGCPVLPTSFRLDLGEIDIVARAISGLRSDPPLLEDGRTAPITALARVVSIMVAGLALSGLHRAPRALGAACAALLATGLAISLSRSGDVWGGSEHTLIIFPLIVLGSHRLSSMDRLGASRKVWSTLLVVLCALTGLGAIINAEPLPVRNVAHELEQEERLVAVDDGLVKAVDFYRDQTTHSFDRVAKLWVPGDREPRMVAVQAFGVQVGPTWIVRPPAEPLYDLAEHLPDARVTYTERSSVQRCFWQESEQRIFCGGPDYQRVMWSFSEFMGVEVDAVLVHPLDDGVIEIRWDDVPFGRKLYGLAGLDDRSFEFSQSPVFVEVDLENQRPRKLTLGAKRGLHPFEIDTSRGPRQGSVVIRVTTPDDRGRHLFIDALTVR